MTTYVREDQMWISLNGDPVPWDLTEGGSYSIGYEPLTLWRVRSDRTLPLVHELIKRVGRPAEVSLEHITYEGQRTGRGLVYEGVLASVAPASCDANSSAMARDSVVLNVYSTRPLGPRE